MGGVQSIENLGLATGEYGGTGQVSLNEAAGEASGVIVSMEDYMKDPGLGLGVIVTKSSTGGSDVGELEPGTRYYVFANGWGDSSSNDNGQGFLDKIVNRSTHWSFSVVGHVTNVVKSVSVEGSNVRIGRFDTTSSASGSVSIIADYDEPYNGSFSVVRDVDLTGLEVTVVSWTPSPDVYSSTQFINTTTRHSGGTGGSATHTLQRRQDGGSWIDQDSETVDVGEDASLSAAAFAPISGSTVYDFRVRVVQSAAETVFTSTRTYTIQA